MSKKELFLFTQGYSGGQLVEKLSVDGIFPTVYTYAAGAVRAKSGSRYLREGFPVRYIRERSFSPEFIEIKKDDIVICFDWTKDFFHETMPETEIYHIHPSLLPLYRGYGAISEQFLRGTSVSGVSMYEDSGIIDGGDIVFQEKIRIEHHHYPIDFIDSATTIASKWIKRMIESGVPEGIKQDAERAFYVQRRRKKQGLIDWGASALYVYNTIRAYSAPYFGSFFMQDGRKKTVWKAICEKWAGVYGEPGCVLNRDDGEIEISCGEGTVIITDMEETPLE